MSSGLLKMDHDEEIDEKLKRKRELSRLRVRKYRRKKQMALQGKLVLQDEKKKDEICQRKLERRRELAKLRARRYRDRKRICQIKIGHVTYEFLNPKSTNPDSSCGIGDQRTETYNSKVLEMSSYVDIPIDIKDEPIKLDNLETNQIIINTKNELMDLNRSGIIQMSIDTSNEQINIADFDENCTEPRRERNFITETKQEDNSALSDEENRSINIKDNLESSENRVESSSDSNDQYRSFVFVDVGLLESEDTRWDDDYDI